MAAQNKEPARAEAYNGVRRTVSTGPGGGCMDRKLQQYVLFCAGMGSSTAWWLIMSTNLAEKASYGQNTTLVLHVW